jgi:hypothetical protein
MLVRFFHFYIQAMDFIMQQGGDVEESSYKYITAEVI